MLKLFFFLPRLHQLDKLNLIKTKCEITLHKKQPITTQLSSYKSKQKMRKSILQYLSNYTNKSHQLSENFKLKMKKAYIYIYM